MHRIKILCSHMLIFVILCFIGIPQLFSTVTDGGKEQPAAGVTIGSSGIYFSPKVNYGGIMLTVSAPDGSIFQKKFDSGSTPYLGLSEINKNQIIDGHYTYELRVNPGEDKRIRDEAANMKVNSDARPQTALTQTGYFLVRGGTIVTSTMSESQGISRPDYTYNEDLYVNGSLCVGTDCVSPETWGNDVLRLKKTDLRINFDDTSSTSSFPANDWRILVNDTNDGGANYFAVEDSTSSEIPFRIEAGAPANSLYIEDYGRIGIKTSTPAVGLHIVDGDSPAIRLEQDFTTGLTAQVWEIVGNESNFFIKDVTNSSKMPFLIQPGAPSSSFCIKSDGKIGIGTLSPAYPAELDTTGINASFVVKRTDGVTNFISATASYAQFGAVSNHPVRILVNSAWKLTLNTDGSLGMSSGASCTTGGVWTNASSRALKENIENLSTEEAMATLTGLNPVKFNYKADNEEKYVGFIAEDAPELVATKDKKGMSPMDVVAVLTKVVQEQQKTINQLQEKIAQLEKNK